MRLGSWFQSPLGEAPCSGMRWPQNAESPHAGFNPHSGKHPVPGLPRVGGEDDLRRFQSPLGEAPCSGSAAIRNLRAQQGVVSIPTRGSTLFRDEPPLGEGVRSPFCFNPHSGKHPVPGHPRPLQRQRPRSVSIPTRGSTLFRVTGVTNRINVVSPGFNPHSGKHPVPGALSASY